MSLIEIRGVGIFEVQINELLKYYASLIRKVLRRAMSIWSISHGIKDRTPPLRLSSRN